MSISDLRHHRACQMAADILQRFSAEALTDSDQEEMNGLVDAILRLGDRAVPPIVDDLTGKPIRFTQQFIEVDAWLGRSKSSK